MNMSGVMLTWTALCDSWMTMLTHFIIAAFCLFCVWISVRPLYRRACAPDAPTNSQWAQVQYYRAVRSRSILYPSSLVLVVHIYRGIHANLKVWLLAIIIRSWRRKQALNYLAYWDWLGN